MGVRTGARPLHRPAARSCDSSEGIAKGRAASPHRQLTNFVTSGDPVVTARRLAAIGHWRWAGSTPLADARFAPSRPNGLAECAKHPFVDDRYPTAVVVGEGRPRPL